LVSSCIVSSFSAANPAGPVHYTKSVQLLHTNDERSALVQSDTRGAAADGSGVAHASTSATICAHPKTKNVLLCTVMKGLAGGGAGFSHLRSGVSLSSGRVAIPGSLRIAPPQSVRTPRGMNAAAGVGGEFLCARVKKSENLSVQVRWRVPSPLTLWLMV